MISKLYSVSKNNLPKMLISIADDINGLGGKCYLVGGQVRDQLLGRVDGRDFDIEVYHINHKQLLAVLKKYGKPNLVGKSFGVYHLVRHGIEFDFSFPRTESKIGVGLRAFAVETDPNLDFKTAASRRDFTINAMGLELPSLELKDEFNGKKDLENKILRHIGPAFSEDSLRVLRGVQFAARFQLNVHPDTIKICREQDLRDLSKERLWEEFCKWMRAIKPSMGLKAFVEMDLTKFFSQIKPLTGSWEKLGSLLDKCVAEDLENDYDKLILMFSALLAGTSLQGVEEFLRSITQEQKMLKSIPALWVSGRDLMTQMVAQKDFSDGDLRRFSLRSPMFLMLFYAQCLAEVKYPNKTFAWEELQKRVQILEIMRVAPTPFLTGKALQELGFKPGRHFGEIIAQSFEKQLDGEFNSIEDAKNWVRNTIPSVNS